MRATTRFIAALWLFGISTMASADPVSTFPRFTFAGNLDFAVTGGSLRTQSNAANPCSVTNSDTATLTGIPAGANIVAAYLYWAGSGSTADLNVTFQGLSSTASRSFSDNFSLPGVDLDFFSGFADVTTRVTGNGSYTFADLTVTNTNLGGGADYCARSTVLSGWGLAVIYEHVDEPLRVINLFDGFQPYRGSQIVLNPSNFVIPSAPIDGRIGILSWEGDVENSAPFGGVSENLIFDGQSTPLEVLTDGLNPTNNQFNSTVNVTGSATEFGVDFDVYDVSSELRAGDTTAQTNYSSGGDLVLLSLQIISVTNTEAANLSLNKSHSDDFSAGDRNPYDLSVSNLGPSAATGPITITDTLTTGLTYQSFNSVDPNWSCTNTGQDVTCSHPGPLAAGNVLADVVIEVDVDASLTPSVTNTATVASATFDPILGNNTATDVANVIFSDLAGSTKSVVDLNGLPVQAGDTLRYTITLNETAGAPVSSASVTDTLTGLLTDLTVVNAAGGSDTSTTTVLQIDGVSVPANGTVDIVFDAVVVGSAVEGDVISNTADITNPANAVTVSAVAPDQAVGATPPASGIKFIYFGDIGGTTNNPTLPLDMSRTPLTAASSPARVRIRRQDNNRVWQITPSLQAPLTLDGSSMPVRLQMRRAGNSSPRDVQVTLAYSIGGSSTFIGCSRQTLATTGIAGLSTSVTREFSFVVNRTDSACNTNSSAPITIPAGAVLTVLVDNEPTVGPGGQAIFVYPFDTATSNTSRVELPASTVINVDSIEFFDTDDDPLTTALLADTVTIRSVVSDPFGSFDIASVDYRLFDATGAEIQAGSLSQIADSGAATAAYELTYTIPGSAPVGFWTIELTANEGTEGTVRHVSSASFEVVDNNVLLEKSVRVISDEVTGTTFPKSIPGAQIEYTISVTNRGASPIANNSIVLQDFFPTEMLLYFGNPVVNPFVFTDGATPSNLTFTFNSLGDAGDDIRFSNDGGTSFVTPVVDVDGYDATSPPINFIEFTPQGTMAADTGSGEPSFTLVFEAQLQ